AWMAAAVRASEENAEAVCRAFVEGHSAVHGETAAQAGAMAIPFALEVLHERDEWRQERAALALQTLVDDGHRLSAEHLAFAKSLADTTATEGTHSSLSSVLRAHGESARPWEMV